MCALRPTKKKKRHTRAKTHTHTDVARRETYVTVLTLSWMSCKFVAISCPHGITSMCTIGLLLLLCPVRITLWKYEGGNASACRYFGSSPIVEYV